MKKIILFLCICIHGSAQMPDKEGSLVKWITLKDAMQKVAEVPRPVLIDFYTDWCGWCKTMMRTTYADPGISNYINTYFYPVKFDAEGKDTVEYLGVEYIPVSDKPRTTHPLAVKLLGNKLMYPTTLFLNAFDKEKNEFKVNMLAAGYLDQKKIEPILIFVLENAGKNASFDDFNAQFQKVFHDSAFATDLNEVKWKTPADGFVQNGKKTLVFINSPWCNSCKVMNASFADSSVLKYVGEKFNLVSFDAEITDTIEFKGQKFSNPKNAIPFHELAVALGRNSISFPSLIVMNESLEVLDVIPSYISPAFLKSIVEYYGEDHFKTRSWADYIMIKGQPDNPVK